jgi:hypothetical protein
MQTVLNLAHEITGSTPLLGRSECRQHNAPSEIRASKGKQRIAVYAGVTLVVAITGFTLLYNYAVSVLESALSLFKP